MATMYGKGDEILAKHPVSLDFAKGKVIDVKGTNYKVKFSDGEEHTVSAINVKDKRPSRNITRSKGRSPARVSPSRKRSPGRMTKTKSPTRLPRSPARSPARSPGRSPGRNRKVKSQIETKQPTISIIRIDSERDFTDETSTTDATESLADSDVLPLQARLNELRTIGVRRSTRLQNVHLKSENRSSSLPLEIRYNKDLRERGSSIHVERNQERYSKERDDSDSNNEKRKLDMNMILPQEWGGRFGALFLTILMPIVFLAPQIACTNNRCKSTYFRFSKDWRDYLNPNSFYAYGLFIVAVTILSIIPIGKLIDSHQNKTGRLQYRINGFLSVFVILVAYAGSIYKGFKVSNFILENMLQLTICGWIYGVVLSLALYFKARKAPIANQNIYGSSHSFLYDFWQGGEVNPRIGLLDIKTVLIRIALIGTMLIDAATVMKMVERNTPLSMNNLNFVLLIAVILRTTYILDRFVFESMTLTSFEITQQGTGYMLIVGYLMYPFVSTLQTRFLLYNKTPLNFYVIIPCAIAFTVGYLIYRISNYQKDAFRRNPFSPAISHLQSISTNRGKKLIVSGLWGYVRHPNYLGDLIIHWSIALIVLVTDVIPYISAILCTLSLITRALRDNARCKARYNVAWNEYCSRVKYMLLKRIF